MKRNGIEDLQPYLARLKALPFVRGARFEREVRLAEKLRADALVRLRTPKGGHTLRVEIKRTHLTRPLVNGLLARMRTVAGGHWILFAPYVGTEIGRYLRENNANYLDAAGNCFLVVDKDYYALVEGKRPEKRAPAERGVRGPGHQVLFAILAKPDLLNAPVRTLAEAAAAGKTAAAEALKRLESEGLVGVDQEGRRLLRPRAALDRWLAGYATLVRPRLLIGRFRTDDPGPEVLERRIERELGKTLIWAWGGGAAAMRLTGQYRGPETILHVDAAEPDLGKRLTAIPADDGRLIILGVPGRLAFEGAKPRTVHPLLVYTELLVAGLERARETATEILGRHLAWLSR